MHTPDDARGTTLVIGGTGKTGRRVAARLQALGRPVRIGSRSATPAFDWDDRATWAPALRGTRAAYIAFYPDLAVPGSPELIAELAATALREGARRLVLLSGRGEEEARRAEAALAASGAEWTVVRCSWFMQNFSEDFWLEPLRAGVLALPAGEIPVPFVHADDIADVAVAALTEDGHGGAVYELTGPRALTFGEAVEQIAAASGRDLRYVPVPLGDFARESLAQGVPAEVIDLLGYLFTDVLTEANAGIGDGVQRALGRPPRDFATYARETTDAGVWTPALAA